MVNERKNNGDGELIVNSTSLEDVAQNEASDTRAHSVTSIHTASDPNTPTYEDLQTKLETSNRNIQNIKDQQQQLLRLQQAAKQHLLEMENIRNQTRTHPVAGQINRNADGVPEYESVDQVHDDMANLVNRMKTLTTFIQGQNELTALLGEDGPEILAEQEALQRKLEELKSSKQDMKNLVSELQEISNSAERSAQAQQQQQQQQRDEPRVVSVEYQRVVPIELIGAAKQQSNMPGQQPQQHKPIQNGHYQHHNGIHNGLTSHSDDTSDELNSENNLDEDNQEMVAETADLIRQKMADINAMKNQLKRLKDMMETVRMIEEKTEGKSIKDIGNDIDEEQPILAQRESQQKLLNRNSVPVASPLLAPASSDRDDRTAEEEEMSEKVRMLHEMTEDLRQQARQMSSERDRLKAIKDEIRRRRDMAEKNSIRENSVSRPISSTNTNLNNDAEKQLLEAEYEAKKKEFEKLCQRLQEEDTVDARSDNVHEEHEAKPELSQQYNRDNWRCSNVASIPSVHSCKGQSDAGLTPLRGKDSADSGAADVHGQPSIEAASFKSGSSRSYSVPPPMRSINNREMPWRKNSQDNASSQFNHFIAPPPPPPIPQQLGMPSNWNPAYYYSTPYAQQQCSPHFHSGGGGGGDCCTHQCHSNSTLNASSQQLVTNSVSHDPVLLQQFIQTQHMLINSVSQCNQLLWHQQKEINNLNNAVLLLQERLLNSPEINLARAESVPNPIAATFCIQATNRAQSEQPQPYPQQQQHQQSISPTIRTHHHAHQNVFHHYRRNISQTQTQCGHSHCCGGGNTSTNTSYNNFTAEQQQGASATSLCSQVPSSTQASNQNFLNNDIPPNSSGPGPIFMHHHNNTITPMQHHHNNSNLLNSQQNCLNSPNPPNSQSTVGAATVAGSTSGTTNNINSVPNTSSNAAAAAAALNNQVPPGNRANNYWDNFRSYSRQNLLSSNSCKSNEEQNHYYQQMNPSSVFGQNLLSSSSSSSVTNQNLNGFRNLYQQQHGINNCSGGGNNVTTTTAAVGSGGGGGIIANLDANKHVHTFRNQFNNINGLEQQQQQQQPLENSMHDIQQQQQQNILSTSGQPQPPPPSLTAPNNMENFEQHQQQQQTQPQQQQQNSNFMDNLNVLNDDELFNYNNNNGNNVAAAIFGNPDVRNMNFSINEFQKKIPYKTPCNSNTKRSRNSQSSPLLNEIYFNQRMMNNVESSGSIQQQQQQQQQNESCENMTTIQQAHHQQQQQQQAVGADVGTIIGDNRDQLNQFGFGINNNIQRSFGERIATVIAATESGLDNQNDIPEEMKRNLLKNALKNEKFTTKFFESLRENVCCEIHSILHRTDTLNPQCLLQFLKELHNYNVYKRSYSNGGGGGGGGGGTESNDDDSNEFYDGDGDENERNRQQQQQHLQAQSLSSLQSLPQQQQMSQLRNNNANNQIQLQQQQQQISNKDSNNSMADELVIRGEDNRDNEIMNSLINSQDLRRLAYKIMFESTTAGAGGRGEGRVSSTPPPPVTLSSSSSLLTRSEKDKKIGLKYDKMSSQRSSPKIPNEVYRPDYELVNYLMSNIRNNIRQSHIDDETIIRIAQLTASALENHQISQTQTQTQSLSSCSFQIDRNLISPKELYRRMKSFEIRNRDTFLARYETYLQTLFVMKVSNEDSTINNVNLIVDKKITDNTNNMITGTRDGSDVNLSLNYNTENNQNIRKISQTDNNNSNSKSNISLEETTTTTTAIVTSSSSSNEMAANSGEMNSAKTLADSTVGSVTVAGGEGGGGGGGKMQQIFGITNSKQQAGQQNQQLINVGDGSGNMASMFFRNASVYHHQHHHLSPDTSSNAVIVATTTTTAAGVTATTTTTTTNTMNNSNNIMNEDLAEADQICSTNNVAAGDSNVYTDSGDGNYLISLQQRQQQQNDNNSSLPSLLSNHHNQQKQSQISHRRQHQTQHQCLETGIGDYFNDHHYQSINSTTTTNNNINHENGIINGTRDNIQNLSSNYSNFMRESHESVPPSSISNVMNHHYHNQQQQQQKHHYHNRDNDEYESQYFKKYLDGIQNEQNLDRGLRDEDDTGGGNVMIKCQGLGRKYDNNGINCHIENDVNEDEIEDDRNENVNGDCANDDDDDDDDGDDDDDEEEDDRAQFMMTDAACALVFPIIPTTKATETENGSTIDLLSQQNSSMNCIQAADSSTTIDFGTIPTTTSGSRLPSAIATATAFIGDITATKRNSVP